MVRSISTLVCAAALVAIPTAGAHVPAGASGGGPVARAAGDAETIATRTRFFGAGNVDPQTGAVRRDRVIFSWFGVTNFAAAIRGHVILMDAWVPRGAHSGYVPVTPTELAKLRPELILLGHGHFDHAADAVPVALAAGAPIVGTGEHCEDMRERSPALPPSCVAAIPAGAPAGTRATPALLRGVELTVVKHLHSATTPPDGQGLHVPVLPPPATTSLEHPPTPEDLEHLVGHLPDSEGGTLLWRFRFGDLSIVWHDSSGALSEQAPDVLESLRDLRPVDIQLGAIQTFNQVTTDALRDPRQYIETLAPEVFVPIHHDDWAAGITTNAKNYEAPFYEELARIEPERRPQIRFIHDPVDYVRPEALTFPVAFDPLRVERRCGRRGRLRVALRGDTADVRAARFRLGRRIRRDRTAPFRVTFGRRAVRLARRSGRKPRLRARAIDVEGAAQQLRKTLPRCAGR